MRQAYDRGISRQTMSRYQAHAEWEHYQPPIQEFPNSQDVRLGTKLSIPTSNRPDNMRPIPSRELYKLFINGIHSDTTENGLRHIFSNYGNPISIKLFRTNNNLHQPIAFVEFESQYEADNAIVALDGKPPLNWEVVYANRRLSGKIPHGDQDLVSLAIASVVGRQNGVVQAVGATTKSFYSRQSPCSIEMESSLGIMHRKSVSPDMHVQCHLCHVCGKQASFVCTVCKVRYCSSGCQSRDWPTHQLVCKPPPALLQEFPRSGVSLKGVVSKPFHGSPDISSPLPQNERPLVATCDDQIYSNNYCLGHRENNDTFEVTSPDLYLIKRTHPLDQAETSMPLTPELSVAVHRNLDGRQETTNSVAAINMMDAIKSLSINKEHGRPESNGHSINQQPSSQPRSPSANYKSDETSHAGTSQSNHDTPKNYLENGFAQNNSPVVANKLQCDFESSPVVTSHSFCSGNDSPKTAPVSPSCKVSQTRSSEAIKVYAKKFVSTQLKQQFDDSSEVNVCSAKSPDEFYVQFYRYRKMLEEIMASVASSAPNSDPLVNPVEGLPCLALFPEDRCWYRAEILKILPDGIGIRYVDFGNTILMPNTLEHLRMMEHSLAQHPFCAVKVKLANVLPVSGITWNSDVKKKFKELVENKPFLMDFVQMDADHMCVRLKNQDRSDFLSSLIQDKFVKSVEVLDELDQFSPAIEIPLPTPSRETVADVLKPSVVCSQVLEENGVFESKDQLENTEKKSISCVPKTLMKKNFPLTEAEFVKTSDRMEPNITENGLALYDIIENPQEPSENNVPKVSPSQLTEVGAFGFNPASLPSEGKISEDDTSDEFFYDDGPFLDLPEKESFQALIIKAEDPQLITLRVENNEISMKLTKLQEEIALYANGVACGYHPKLNEICVARFPGGRWYRAVCLNVIHDRQPTGTRYLCNQVDFGELNILDASKIRRAKKWMIDLLPYLAQQAVLEGTDSMEQMEPKLVERFAKILPENSVVDVNVVNRVDMSYVVRIPKVNATLSFERLL
ncbi:LOW QUALITY PROTEIN: uncharacterized protein LOC116930611 [Daphnia magna]|uniref:LOW QUALITY PROTEIN: uncharacterized protein LOC116930611 n=1 Tax=Daphnia magna TaxID=35525 RepID=UPI001E1BB6DF|nr:LOW QUALITY PROTEIN: uncharacterized protein LOC116930611 [Daphnia magna]